MSRLRLLLRTRHDHIVHKEHALAADHDGRFGRPFAAERGVWDSHVRGVCIINIKIRAGAFGEYVSR